MVTRKPKRKGRKKIPLSDQFRKAIEDSGYTRYAISKETGIDAGVLCHFVAGRRGISMRSLDALGEFLGLEIIRRKDKR